MASKLYGVQNFESACSKMNRYGCFGSPMDNGTWIGYQDHPAVSAFMVAEHSAHDVFDPRPVPGYTHQLFGQRPTPGIWNAHFNCSIPIAAETFPLTGDNGAGSGAPQIFDPRSTTVTHQHEPHGNENYTPSTQSGSISPLWVPNAINPQSEWCSSSIERPHQLFDAMPTLQGRVLLVRILNAMYPVTLDMLNHVFSLYGSVEKIVYASPLTAHQVLIQYQQHQMASLALRLLQGHSLYQSCCYLEVKYALGSELQVLCPSLGVGNIFACESTEHDTSTMPNQRVIEQSAPMQILDELPSSHGSKVAVKLCKSKVVQAATMVSQGSPASSTPLLMHVDDMQVSISVQDVPGLFEEMPVYDVYEEDRSASLNFVSELCEIVGQQNQYASEKPIYDCEEPHCGAKLSSGESDHGLLAVCFNNASDNAFSHEATDFTFPIGHVILADRSVNLTNEKSIQAASSLFVQGH